MLMTVLVVSAIACLVMMGVYAYHAVIFTQNCGGYLDRAAHANTIDGAAAELEIALKYIESRKLTSGYTSILWRTPDEDMGFWYNNLKKSYLELETVKSDASLLEKSNVLMKLQETLEFKPPRGISVYPMNALLAVLSWSAFIVLLGLAIMIPIIDP